MPFPQHILPQEIIQREHLRVATSERVKMVQILDLFTLSGDQVNIFGFSLQTYVARKCFSICWQYFKRQQIMVVYKTVYPSPSTSPSCSRCTYDTSPPSLADIAPKNLIQYFQVQDDYLGCIRKSADLSPPCKIILQKPLNCKVMLCYFISMVVQLNL